MQIIDAEQKVLREKTERLRTMRLAQKPKRVVFNSSLTKDGWMVTTGGEPVSNHETQKEAEAAAIAAAKNVYKDGGLGQAVLHKANGMIRQERTYGKDPERTPG